ncbi:hypothetical protein B0H63DRAFT_463461 [Podospora didyma]|uniref:C2H2-type domain-containing protein n=1 Tax=Podospora didyma TaxID=330526 RepID=A0AAE0U3C9_9PEZI|nr:hypothetical protein B0H63DRAFT_463461 [Podospora didyma]
MSAAYAAAHSIANEAESGDSVMEDAEDKPIDRNEQDGSSGAQDDTDMLEDDLDAMDVARSDEDDRAIVAPELVPPAITMAEPNRPYDKWIDPQTGEVLPLLGVLLPTGYKLDKTVPGRKWICPVRSCKRLFIKAQDLSFHFLRTHYGALLNDNCDGTFSVTGFYKDNRVGITKSGKVLIPGPPIVASKQASEEQEPPVSSWVHRPEGHGHLNLDRRRTSRKYDADEEDEEQQDDEQVASRSETTSLTRKLRPRRQLSRPSAGTSEPSPALLQSAPKSSLLSDGMFQSAESLEMETWEMAPGRLRESTGDNPENIAYSKAYLSANHEASVCDDVTVRVSTIYSGTTLKLNADATKMRICSVGTGKVSVQLGGEPEFVIGPHGMFKVKPGVACVVRNTMYLDATLHMTLLSGFT